MTSKIAIVTFMSVPIFVLACGQAAPSQSERRTSSISNALNASSVLLTPQPGVAHGDSTSAAARAMSKPPQAFPQGGPSISVSPSGKR